MQMEMGGWVHDDQTSPCIDAGDLGDPVGPEPFPNGGIVNLGAYAGTERASMSYFGRPPCQTPVAGDINGDCIVDWADLFLMGVHWFNDPESLPRDPSLPSPEPPHPLPPPR